MFQNYLVLVILIFSFYSTSASNLEISPTVSKECLSLKSQECLNKTILNSGHISVKNKNKLLKDKDIHLFMTSLFSLIYGMPKDKIEHLINDLRESLHAQITEEKQLEEIKEATILQIKNAINFIAGPNDFHFFDINQTHLIKDHIKPGDIVFFRSQLPIDVHPGVLGSIAQEKAQLLAKKIINKASNLGSATNSHSFMYVGELEEIAHDDEVSQVGHYLIDITLDLGPLLSSRSIPARDDIRLVRLDEESFFKILKESSYTYEFWRSHNPQLNKKAAEIALNYLYRQQKQKKKKGLIYRRNVYHAPKAGLSLIRSKNFGPRACKEFSSRAADFYINDKKKKNSDLSFFCSEFVSYLHQMADFSLNDELLKKIELSKKEKSLKKIKNIIHKDYCLKKKSRLQLRVHSSAVTPSGLHSYLVNHRDKYSPVAIITNMKDIEFTPKDIETITKNYKEHEFILIKENDSFKVKIIRNIIKKRNYWQKIKAFFGF